MHFGWPTLAVVLLSVGAFCADQPNPPTPSKQDLKQAKSAYAKGMKLQNSRRLVEALDEFNHAVDLAPQNPQYLTAREMIRQQLVFENVEQGNTGLRNGRQVEALASFRAALALDPQNAYAQQRLRDAAGPLSETAPELTRVVANSGELHLKPSPVRGDFHYRGDPRGLLTQIGKTYGITAVFDDSVISRTVRFDITAVDFYTAMEAASAITKSFWTPLSENQMLVASDSVENHRNFDRMVLRTFYIPGLSSPQAANELANLMRSMFDISFVMAQANSGTMVLRAPQHTLDAATEFLTSLDSSKPQVMLDIRVYEINHTFARDMGLSLPNQFQMFNIPVGALAALGGQNIQD